jgi:3-oxoadipate enol-lactonase
MPDWVDANGLSLRYSLEGAGDSTVVLLHEMGGSLESWDDVVAPLLAAGHRVLRFDQRGCGQSEKPRGEINQALLAADLAALLDGLRPPAPWHLVGVAASCVPALTLAVDRPDTVGRLVLCNPVTGVSVERGAALRERAELAETAGLRVALPQTLDRSWPADLGSPEAYRRYRARYLANDPVCFAGHNRALIGVDVGPTVARLAAPVLVVGGRFDQVRPVDGSRAFAEAIPGARFEYVDSGHMMPPQAPEALAALIVAFLGEPAPAGVTTAAGGAA